MDVVVFEDQWVRRLFPVTVGRPAYAVSCATYRLIDWLPQFCPTPKAAVRNHLAQIQQLDYPLVESVEAVPDSPVLYLNARLVPSKSCMVEVGRLLEATGPCAVWFHDQLAAACWPAGTAAPKGVLRAEEATLFFQSAGITDLPRRELHLPLLEYPHDVVRCNMEAFSENIQHRLAQHAYEEVEDGVFLAEGARLGPYVVTDTAKGPIVLERNAQIGPHCFLSGPAYLGPGARVTEHAAIKDAVSLGHTTKIGGEVEASVIEPYTNKQHHGFLGHSYLGSWINLGAGTCNSDLKNTYGSVNMEYRGEKIATGMQFFGCIMGDYAKSAINTGIFTGKTVGACSMLYGFVTTNVPSFVNYARLFGQVIELPPDVMIATQQRMFSRRNVTQRSCDVQLIRDMYELTQDERQLAGEPLSL